MRKREIDPVAAIILYNCGCSWDEVGRIMAKAIGRRSPFQGLSVMRAVRAYDRRATNETGALWGYVRAAALEKAQNTG